MIIREYKPEDREGIEKCIFELQAEEYERRPDYWELPEKAAKPYYDYLVESIKKQSGNIFVAEVDGVIAGMVAVQIITEDSPCVAAKNYAYIPDLSVRKEFRGTGLGKLLIEKAEEYAREYDRLSVQMHVAKGNPAHDFYHHLGYSDDDNFIRLEKKLSPQS